MSRGTLEQVYEAACSCGATAHFRVKKAGDAAHAAKLAHWAWSTTHGWQCPICLITAPTMLSATTSTDGTKVIITFSKAMAIPPNDQKINFLVNIDGVLAGVIAIALGDTASKYELTLEDTIAVGNVVTCQYNPGTITAADGGRLAADLKPVVNVVIPPAPPEG